MGDKMKKFLIVISIILYTGNSFAEPKNGFGDSMECYLETDGTDSAWFCGKHDRKCKQKLKNKHNVYPLVHGGSFSYGSVTAWCCDGTISKQGHFVEQRNWTTSETITVQLANGTCTYQKKINACGEIVSDTPCTEPTTCTSGTIKRNGECIAPCGANDGNMAYESVTSNKCIECPTNASQGIDSNDICTKCNSATDIWDANTKKCISRTEAAKKYHKISNATMKKCWQCPNNEMFKTCATILSLPDAEQKTHKDFTATMTNCKVASE
jgi:hypothetical protein